MKPWIARGRSGERAEDGPAAGKAPRYTHSASRGASWDPYARKPSIRRTLPTPAEQKEVLKAYGLSHVVWADEARGSDLLRGKTVARISVDTEGNQEEDWNAAVDPTLVQIALELVNPSQDRSLSTAAEIVVVLFAPLVHDSSTLDWLRKATKQLYVYVWCTNDSKELSYVASLLKTSKTVGQQPWRSDAPRPLGLATACYEARLKTSKSAVDWRGFVRPDRPHGQAVTGWSGTSLETLPSDLRDYAAGDAVLGVLLLRCAGSDFGERQVSTADHTDRPDQFALCAQFLSAPHRRRRAPAVQRNPSGRTCTVGLAGMRGLRLDCHCTQHYSVMQSLLRAAEAVADLLRRKEKEVLTKAQPEGKAQELLSS